MMKDRYKTMTTKKKQLTVKPEYDEFLQAVDEYTTQIPLVIRQQFRQALHSEYEGNYEKVEEICRDMLAGHPDHVEVQALLGRALLSQQKYKEAEETLREVLEKEPQRRLPGGNRTLGGDRGDVIPGQS